MRDPRGGRDGVRPSRERRTLPGLRIEAAPQADIALIPLHTKSKGIKGYAIVDVADADWANQWRWRLDSHGYAARSTLFPDGKWREVFLHRELLGLVRGDGMEGDHRDRDRLNCRRRNLRPLPKKGNPNSQNRGSNLRSSSSYRGVSWHKANQKWTAQVVVNHKKIYLGSFDSEDDAAIVAKNFRQQTMPYSVEQ